jgi:hypothetical protein
MRGSGELQKRRECTTRGGQRSCTRRDHVGDEGREDSLRRSQERRQLCLDADGEIHSGCWQEQVLDVVSYT